MSTDISPEQLKAICNVIADTSSGLTKTEIKLVLGQCGIEAVDDGYRSNGYTYSLGLNKRDWLYNCLANELDKSRHYTKFYSFLENTLNPTRFTTVKR
jgi:hypothetical protein